MSRAPLVLSLALASLGRLTERTPPGEPASRQRGRAVSIAVKDGALLVDTGAGQVLLLVAWDATIEATDSALGLEDLRVGDAVEWLAETGQTVAMIDHLRVVGADA